MSEGQWGASEIIANLYVGDLQDAQKFHGMIISVLPDWLEAEPAHAVWMPFLKNGLATLESTAALTDHAAKELSIKMNKLYGATVCLLTCLYASFAFAKTATPHPGFLSGDWSVKQAQSLNPRMPYGNSLTICQPELVSASCASSVHRQRKKLRRSLTILRLHRRLRQYASGIWPN